MKNDDAIQDWRSTGRRRARKVLFESYRNFACETCGATVHTPPKDAPDYFDEIWPDKPRILSPYSMQAQHMSKDVRDNDEEYLKWMCSSCHKLEDLTTAKGQSTMSQKRLL